MEVLRCSDGGRAAGCGGVRIGADATQVAAASRFTGAMACKLLIQTRMSVRSRAVNIVEMPLDRLSDSELSVRQWEAVMAGDYGCAQHRQVESEMSRRLSARDNECAPRLH
jgi:hypothetical protein